MKITDKYIPQIDFKYTIDNEQLDGKPYLVLRNSDTLFKYLIEEFQIDDKCTLKTSIGILIGIQDSNKILIVADENFDNNYANDSVYCVKIKNPFLTKKQFAELFPIISIASKNLS